MSKTPEGSLLKLILDYLAAKHVFAMRMNTGAVKMDDKRFMRFGTPGCADMIAFSPAKYISQRADGRSQSILQRVIWIEVKSPKGKQSDLQKSFQAKVESEGHMYILARSLEDVKVWI